MVDPSPDEPGAGLSAGSLKPSRKRVVFSCALCRAGKFKCDRKSPCSQCARRGLAAGDCVYAPLPEKMRKSRSMAARVKELEGTVRTLMSESGAPPLATTKEPRTGRVVFGEEGKGTYVGATHFMTILDDLEDLKQFFDESDPEEDGAGSPQAVPGSVAEMWMLSDSAPRSREDILALFPPLQVLNSLIMRYFAWHSPSSSVIHRPTFNHQYHAFRKDRMQASYEFLALLFMVLAEATLFAIFSGPQELSAQDPVPLMERFRSYRTGGVWALSAADYTSPSLHTIPPLLLHLEAEFVLSRSTPMRCYLLSSTCIRLMLRLGLHRDPGRLPNISVFSGEMRRRMWHFGLQIDMLVSFQMGLPSMIHGVDSDTRLPRNLKDDDFGEDTAELPPERPHDEQGPLTYFIWKTNLGKVFCMIAKQTNSIAEAPDAEVMRLDGMLRDVWRQVPSFLKVRPLEECVTDEPLLVVERFSLGSIFHKALCVLHRRHLLQSAATPEHNFSRSACLRAALVLLDYQKMNYEATRPGSMLAQYVWFLRPIVLGDFLLAAMIVYISLRTRSYPEGFEDKDKLPSKEDLYRLLAQSGYIWAMLAETEPGYGKPASILARMVAKVQPRPGAPEEQNGTSIMVREKHPKGTPVIASLASLEDSSTDQSITIPNLIPSSSQSWYTPPVSADDTMADGFDAAWLSFSDSSSIDWQIIDEAMRVPDPVGIDMPGQWAELPLFSDQSRQSESLDRLYAGLDSSMMDSIRLE
ncbi:hypothetical protein GQ53DRAFT_718463 [Thozetella sp. PMI_491]|nr:hypothetical protein GQ53DRAFT_718463 [Thozetella sp. PMI_491]